jgi:hypothetical protein
MSSLAGLRPGDEFMVPEGKDGYCRATVLRRDDRWVTDHQGRRYWMASGRSEWHDVRPRYARTTGEHEMIEARAELTGALGRWGLAETSRRLTGAQLRQVLTLLRGFKMED